MADLGTIGMKALLTKGSQLTAFNVRLRRIVCGAQEYTLGGKSITEGSPAQPSLRLDARGSWRFRWTVSAGTRTIKINVKQVVNLSPRPRMTIIANPEIGVAANVNGSAASGAGWVMIGPLTITPTSNGAVWVVLEALYDGHAGNAPCYFDHVVTT